MTVLVAGITRSGLSLTMQMLQAGGYPTVGDYPAFECFPMGLIPWGAIGDRAVKVVDVQRQFPPQGQYSVILLRRDLIEQAKSFNKFSQAFGLPAMSTLKIRASFSRDYGLISRWLQHQHRYMELRFETLIQEPDKAAASLQEFLGQPMDLGKMKAAVRKRDAYCYPGLLELELIADREGA